MTDTEQQSDVLALTAEIVAAHVSNNSVATSDVASLIGSVYKALSGLGAPPAEVNPEKPQPAVTVRKSLSSPSHIISMIDGKPYKMLKRHLGLHGHTPKSYREAYGLPHDYPMVAADYGEQRRQLAKKIGLGRKPKAPAAVPAKTTTTAKAPAMTASRPRRARKTALGDAVAAVKEPLGGE